MTGTDETLLRRAFALAATARARGDRPFAAVIADAEGRVLAEAGSTQGASGDGTLAHSEMNACQAVIAAAVPRETLRGGTIYSSGEPCAMCSAAIFYTGIGRVVFGLSAAAILHLRNAQPHTAGLSLSCAEVLASAAEPVAVLGPCLEVEGAVPHQGYWTP
ncbi:cytidine/deoxycytidylate deaminase-like protein [Humitalea rosea]|uniref:Cytidine/deoxycytidylate deaminase-like protein n=1 Tax=Humitalea rosea TaxID=990373 RepID=A0A2W7JDV3_9PROT|nr:deaminase [Humitalea rosea]PZW50372.1 cytidine/deoxycytidylate deaminase-like protein [Humitalea rosea]